MAIKISAEIYKEFIHNETSTYRKALEAHVINWTLSLVPWILTYLMFIEILVSGFKLYSRNTFLYT